MADTGLRILNKQITEFQAEIEKLKIQIADCVIEAHSTKPKEVRWILDNLNKMIGLIETVINKEKTLSALTKTKEQIENELDIEDKILTDLAEEIENNKKEKVETV